MERMIDNIFSNARKYAVSELIVSLEELGDRVRLVVENDIDKNMKIDADRVFEPFYRSEQEPGSMWAEDDGRISNYGGSGLGLYIVKQLADSIGIDVKAKTSGHRFAIEILITPIKEH